MNQGAAHLAPEADVANMHCHTFYSFNAYGHSPTSLAWLAKKLGLKLIGMVDFDVLDGVAVVVLGRERGEIDVARLGRLGPARVHLHAAGEIELHVRAVVGLDARGATDGCEQHHGNISTHATDDSHVPLGHWRVPVSYTHLRAHETVLDIVFRLMLEKKTHIRYQ